MRLRGENLASKLVYAPCDMLVILGSAALGYFAGRRWWLVFGVPIVVLALSPLNTLSIFTVFAGGVVGFGLGMLIRHKVDRKAQASG